MKIRKLQSLVFCATYTEKKIRYRQHLVYDLLLNLYYFYDIRIKLYQKCQALQIYYLNLLSVFLQILNVLKNFYSLYHDRILGQKFYLYLLLSTHIRLHFLAKYLKISAVRRSQKSLLVFLRVYVYVRCAKKSIHKVFFLVSC